jgi:hypothetical protein
MVALVVADPVLVWKVKIKIVVFHMKVVVDDALGKVCEEIWGML